MKNHIYKDYEVEILKKYHVIQRERLHLMEGIEGCCFWRKMRVGSATQKGKLSQIKDTDSKIQKKKKKKEQG